MNAVKLILRGAAYYWRTHLGVAAGAAVATAVLVGALVVGDSVRYTLGTLALRRLGRTTLAMSSAEGFFRAESVGNDAVRRNPVRSDAVRRYPPKDALTGTLQTDLAAAMQADLPVPLAPVLLLDGSARTPDSAGLANNVQVVGADRRFWAVGGLADPLAGAASDDAVINDHLARQLGVAVGDVVLLRVPVPSGLPREAPLSTDRDAVAAIRATVRAIIDDSHFGRFSLRANQLAPQTAFVQLAKLQQAVKLADKANVMLVAGADDPRAPTVAQADAALRKHLTLDDAGLQLRDLGAGVSELRTARVFLDGDLGRAALAVDHAAGVLAYFVDEVRLGDRAAPYCILAGMDANRPGSPPSPVPPEMGDDEILLNSWLADDLSARPGDKVTLTYRTLGPLRTLETAAATFRVRAIIPIAGAADDPNLMPDFPGLADVKNCTDWRPGVEVDTHKLRPKDVDYWNARRGTPKAFLTLRAAQKMWGNRFGNLTAVRYARSTDILPVPLAAEIIRRIDPRQIGMYFTPVRQQAVAAAEPTSDFGGLFLGLSFFLIVAAVLLTGLLFVFGIEQRSRQVGLLLAVGFRPWRVRRWLLAEGGVLAVGGAIVGSAAGLGYTRVVLAGLGGVWRGAAASSRIIYHAEPVTVAMGAAIGVAVAVAAMLVTLWLQGRATPRELLSAAAQGRVSGPAGRGKRRAGLLVGGLCIGGAIALVRSAGSAAGMAAAGAFFGAGSMVLPGGLALCYSLLAKLGVYQHAGVVSVAALGVRSTGLRRWRSLTTAGLLACGIFLVASVEVFRLDPRADALSRSGGAGGFALYGESATPILHDLNAVARGGHTAGGPQLPAIDPNELADVNFVEFRVHDGDDASCLNLNRARSPRVLGVKPAKLDGRFSFVEKWPGAGAASAGNAGAGTKGAGNPWMLLDANLPDGAVPAIGDDPTIQWALQKGLGQDVTVLDERGRAVKLRLVAKIGSSILQGSLLISDANFRRLFPSASGYRAVLVDAPPAEAEKIRRDLMAALANNGLELTAAPNRLAMFAEVQNTYLSIFAALGGLGLVLGCVAIGVVVLRNVLERRGELALLRAVGFTKARLVWMVLCEHWALLALGMVCGVAAAVIAVTPALRSPTAAAPLTSWLATLAAVAASGILWTCLAAAAALRGNLLDALRNE
jgi:ABC-type antimicrobial peptide transport system permease subunit